MRSISAFACSALLWPTVLLAQAKAPTIEVDRDAALARCTAQIYPLDEALLNRLSAPGNFSRQAMGFLRATRDVCGCGFEQAQKALSARQLLLFSYRGFEPVGQGIGQVFDAADRAAVDRFEKDHKGYRQCAEVFERRVNEASAPAQ